ncbi:MAG: hypothetical protein Q8886_02580 [Candidatus Phytoplasma australasiaticum]|nr:hypothetical protein [Candidatus Phytoplasma australasiaticum]
MKAVPQGSVPVSAPVRWLVAVKNDPSVLALRRDAREAVGRLAFVLTAHARRDGTTAPGWDVLMLRTGMARRTLARWLAWLRSHGLLGVVETGSTPKTRAGRFSEAPEDSNARAVYLLVRPQEETPEPAHQHVSTPRKILHPPSPAGASPSPDRGRAGASVPPHGTGTPLAEPLRRSGTPSRPATTWRKYDPTRTRAQERAAAARIRALAPCLRPLSDRAVRSLLLPWLRRGWTPGDVLHALDHTPDGRRRTWTSDVEKPAGWLCHRLAPWREAEAPSQVSTRRHRLQVQAHAVARAERQAVAAEAVRGEALTAAIAGLRAAIRRA